MPKQPKQQLKQQKGFAVIKPSRRIEIARMGGQAVSKNREYMSLIGAVGGTASGLSRKRKRNIKPANTK